MISQTTLDWDAVSNVSFLRYQIQIATIFNEIASRISRLKFQTPAEDNISLSNFYYEITGRLEAWDELVQQRLNKPREDKDKSEPVCGLPIFYRYTAILNRYVRHANINAQVIDIHIDEAYSHARKMLEILQRLSYNKKTDSRTSYLATFSPFISPF